MGRQATNRNAEEHCAEQRRQVPPLGVGRQARAAGISDSACRVWSTIALWLRRLDSFRAVDRRRILVRTTSIVRRRRYPRFHTERGLRRRGKGQPNPIATKTINGICASLYEPRMRRLPCSTPCAGCPAAPLCFRVLLYTSIWLVAALACGEWRSLILSSSKDQSWGFTSLGSTFLRRATEFAGLFDMVLEAVVHVAELAWCAFLLSL